VNQRFERYEQKEKRRNEARKGGVPASTFISTQTCAGSALEWIALGSGRRRGRNKESKRSTSKSFNLVDKDF